MSRSERWWVQVIWAPIIVAITIPLSLITHFTIKKRFGPPQLILSYRGAADADNHDEVTQTYPPIPPPGAIGLSLSQAV